MTEHVSCHCKCKFNCAICNSDQKWNNKTCQNECKNYHTWKKNYSWNLNTCTCENSKYLKSTSVTECDKIIIDMNNVSTKYTITTIVTSNASTNCHTIKVRDCHILHSFIIYHNTIENYYYLLSLCKTKRYNKKSKIMNFKKFVLKFLYVIILMG